MKKFLVILILPVLAFGQGSGVPITGDLRPASGGNFSILDAKWLRGGFHTWTNFSDITSTNLLPLERRKAGMVAITSSDGKAYQLGTNLTTWTELELNISAGANINVTNGIVSVTGVVPNATNAQTAALATIAVTATNALTALASGVATNAVYSGTATNALGLTGTINWGNVAIIYNTNEINIGNNLFVVGHDDSDGYPFTWMQGKAGGKGGYHYFYPKFNEPSAYDAFIGGMSGSLRQANTNGVGAWGINAYTVTNTVGASDARLTFEWLDNGTMRGMQGKDGSFAPFSSGSVSIGNSLSGIGDLYLHSGTKIWQAGIGWTPGYAAIATNALSASAAVVATNSVNATNVFGPLEWGNMQTTFNTNDINFAQGKFVMRRADGNNNPNVLLYGNANKPSLLLFYPAAGTGTPNEGAGSIIGYSRDGAGTAVETWRISGQQSTTNVGDMDSLLSIRWMDNNVYKGLYGINAAITPQADGQLTLGDNSRGFGNIYLAAASKLIQSGVQWSLGYAALATNALSSSFATIAASATNAQLATIAVTATNANLASIAVLATNANLANIAVTATNAQLATIAVTATNANLATIAVTATNLAADLPVSKLAGGSGASATTFWRGDGTWATPAGGGGLTNIPLKVVEGGTGKTNFTTDGIMQVTGGTNVTSGNATPSQLSTAELSLIGRPEMGFGPASSVIMSTNLTLRLPAKLDLSDSTLAWISSLSGGGGGSGGAPTNATYIVQSLNSTLSAERVATAGHGIAIADGGANGNMTWSLGTVTNITFTTNAIPTPSTGNLSFGIYPYNGTKGMPAFKWDDARMDSPFMTQFRNVYNGSGSLIPAGSAVYITSITNSAWLPSVAPAIATNAVTARVYGMTTASIANGTYGMVQVSGYYYYYNTSAFTWGDSLYLSDVWPGVLTNVVPTTTGHWRTFVGNAQNSHASTGTFQLYPSTPTEIGAPLAPAMAQHYFGAGYDGNVIVTNTVTLGRDMYYNNLTIEGTGVVQTAGYKVFVAGTFSVGNGGVNIFHRNGSSGQPGSGAGTGGSGGAAQPAGSLGAPVASNSGGAGGTAAGSQASAAPTSSGLGGGGGASGAGGSGSGGAGGGLRNGGSMTDPTIIGRPALDIIRGVTLLSGSSPGASGGGGGGDGAAGGGGGSGGNGGGIVLLAARYINFGNNTNQPIISANGGNGGSGGSSSAGDRGGGGGGAGGGGGFVGIIYEQVIGNAGTNAVWAYGGNGGAGGNGTGSGTGGNGGGGGTGGQIVLYNVRSGVNHVHIGSAGSGGGAASGTTGGGGGVGGVAQVTVN